MAVAPFRSLIRKEFSLLLSDCWKGVGAYNNNIALYRTWLSSMVSYTELFALGMLIVAIIGLCLSNKRR